ncbi:tRNA lysidine(34) synthetase [Thermosediminibacter litoriperuensis]|uniref:tRNA(Ile)-lysidine synthase TilS/MesJ n=1 Tax=Thermosediminibacter litoriperuensis TaxID=291989 RepID=A0A5S5AUP9_9FIRM|nr:ATP-binding protein [Thermosediminibacter litoriperuensis]TYP56187.1 tRNA(Ile)-lysidine synthase TilS/MesJ [Thermosediminibacter litoriperuensis]
MNRNFGKWFLTKVKKAIIDYGMIENGDKIAVGVSGGKDSTALLYILDLVRKHSPLDFDLVAVNINLGWEMDLKPLADFCRSLQVPLKVVRTDIARVVFEIRKEPNPCSLCSRMRRGTLDSAAVELGCNKVALAHHADDVIETLLLNLIFTGRFDTFEPKTYLSRKNVTLIRPLIYLSERTIKTIVKSRGLPVIESPCPADGRTKRDEMTELLDWMEQVFPRARENILAAIKRRAFFSEKVQ